ncbi:MAG: DNA pilot protein [Microviridae sp.]|nr:MAG: DNA pilot protein [Microviridae sp.]
MTLQAAAAVGGAILGGINSRNQRKSEEANNAANRAHQDKINAENRAEAERIRLINARRADSQIQRQVADGRLAGLSALASMGNAGYSPAPASIAQSSPSQFTPTRSSGAGLAADAIQTLLSQRSSEQQILESRSRTLLNEANAQKLMNNPMQDGGLGQPRHEASTIIVHPEFGKPYKIPNPELYETSTNEGLTGAYLHGAGRAYSGIGRYITKSGIHLKDLPTHMRTKVEQLRISGAKRQSRINKKLGR